MESALRPREIQARIRAGESVDDVAKAAGVPPERIEGFAGPVLAEREHIAGLAQKGSVRRRGETSGHRQLRTAVAERLSGRGVDAEAIDWDALRMDDGRWSVSATYSSGEAVRRAIFYFDLRGRFSVAGNDEGRWVLGEQSPVHGPQPGRRPATSNGEDPDTEPTLDLNDELALVRATQELGQEADEPDLDASVAVGRGAEGGTEAGTEDGTEATIVRLERRSEAAGTADEARFETPDESDQAGTQDAVPELDEASELDLLYDMLGGDGYAEDSGRVYSGLSDNGPDQDRGWEPAVVVDYPLEEAAESPADSPAEPSAESSAAERADEPEVEQGHAPVSLTESAAPRSITEPEQPALDEADDLDGAEMAQPDGPTLVDDEPVEMHASDDVNQEEGAAEPTVRAEPPQPEPRPAVTDVSASTLEPAPGSDSENDASDEDAVPESDEAPASKPPSDDPGPSPVEVSPEPETTEQPDAKAEAEPDARPDAEPEDSVAAGADAAAAEVVEPEVAAEPAKPKPAPKKRKRAEVPSWDEIMFGGPKRP